MKRPRCPNLPTPLPPLEGEPPAPPPSNSRSESEGLSCGEYGSFPRAWRSRMAGVKEGAPVAPDAPLPLPPARVVEVEEDAEGVV
ncbi:uncharacterized protein N0V96_001638 [Colletotrichum fioriniae]|uniref:uncharacterized protein n=1 Tax=Colletotrichum fioriniae TaxID=710243 RepID=UPI0032DACF19|nr:hypothetical protein N0V96_001638 [Colletotrichum fioriniae]